MAHAKVNIMGKARPSQFREIPLSQLIEQVNGPEVRETVYYFGQRSKKQGIELPGQTYDWARNLPQDTGN